MSTQRQPVDKTSYSSALDNNAWKVQIPISLLGILKIHYIKVQVADSTLTSVHEKGFSTTASPTIKSMPYLPDMYPKSLALPPTSYNFIVLFCFASMNTFSILFPLRFVFHQIVQVTFFSPWPLLPPLLNVFFLLSSE